MPQSSKAAITEHSASFSSAQVVSPYDGEHICDVEYVQWSRVDRWLDDAVALHRDRRQWLPAWRRAEILVELASRVEGEAEDFAYLMAREGGKPITDCRVEVARAVLGIRYAAAHIGDAMAGEVIAAGLNELSEEREMVVRMEPIGPVVAISAFNHPLNLIVHQVMPAVAVGAPVLVKPATTTPLTCIRLLELLHECGLPEGWARAVVCDNEVAEQMATDARVAFVSFIGSARVGWHLRSKLAPGTRCALEHGGNAPVVMLPDADFDAAIPALVKGGMSHAGQVCVSVQRVFVPWAEAAGFTRKLAEAAEALKVGNPVNDTTQVGPLILPNEVQRVHAWVMEAMAGGAKVLCGGEKITDYCYQPTVLLDPPDDAKVTREEIFGPVICVYGYEKPQDAIARANDSVYAFQAAVWGRDASKVEKAVQALNAATVMVNDHTAFRVDWMPFGGRGKSGLGVGGIGYTMRDYCQHKLVVR